MDTPLTPDAATIDAARQAFLFRYLEQFDAKCPLCHYNLRHLTQPRCPECGKEIEVKVGLAEHTVLPYTLLMVAVLLPTGMGLLGWVQFAINRREMFDHMPAAMAAVLIGFLLSVFVAPFPILLRRRFLRLTVPRQWTIAALALAEPVLLYGALAAEIALHR